MRLSYSLLRQYQTCGFRTKLTRFDHIPWPSGASANFRQVLGTMNHAGQEALLLGQPVRPAIVRAFRRVHVAALPPGWDAERIIDRACGAVARFGRGADGFNVEDYEPVRWDITDGDVTLAQPLIDTPLYVPLDPPIGIFDELVVKPDAIVRERSTGYLWLYDWKWVGKLDDGGSSDPGTDDDAELDWTNLDGQDFDLQAAMYQWGVLRATGLVLKGCGMVQGRIEEPTPFRVNKDGTVSKRQVRNDWPSYVAACETAGHEPDLAMKDRLLPWFKHHRSFRSMREVDAVWANVVVPLVEKLSQDVGFGFARRFDKMVCMRCTLREDCLRGVSQQHENPAFNTTRVLDAR